MKILPPSCIVLSVFLSLFCGQVQAEEGRVVRGPASIIIPDDFWLSSWTSETWFGGTDSEFYYQISKHSSHFCVVSFNKWDYTRHQFVVVQVQQFNIGEKFRTFENSWVFTITPDCKTTWENLEEKGSSRNLITPHHG